MSKKNKKQAQPEPLEMDRPATPQEKLVGKCAPEKVPGVLAAWAKSMSVPPQTDPVRLELERAFTLLVRARQEVGMSLQQAINAFLRGRSHP